jgi:hypothetical protein
MVAEIYATAATWKDVNDTVSLRCGQQHFWRAVETLGCWWLENPEPQMALQNCDHSNDDDDDGNGNSTGGG